MTQIAAGLGALAAGVSIIHLAIANSDMHTWLESQMRRSASADEGPFAAFAQGFSALALGSVQLKPGAGLYTLAGSLSFASTLLLSRSEEKLDDEDDAWSPNRRGGSEIRPWLIVILIVAGAIAAVAFFNAKRPQFGSQADTKPAGKQEILEPTPAQIRQLRTIVKNLTLSLRSGDTVGPVKFSNGEAHVDTESYSLDTNHLAFGDLDGDGKLDAVVILGESGGGSGYFESLVGILDVTGNPSNSAERDLGDRVAIRSISVTNGVVRVSMLTQGPDDGRCCPTKPQTLRVVLRQDRFLDVGR